MNSGILTSPMAKAFICKLYYENIITVGALDKNMQRGNQVTGEKSVDIFAPGKKIRSAFPNYQVAEMTGTSQATAFVSGAVSLILEKKTFSSNNDKFFSTKDLLFNTGYRTPILKNICFSSRALNIKALKKLLRFDSTIKTASY